MVSAVAVTFIASAAVVAEVVAFRARGSLKQPPRPTETHAVHRHEARLSCRCCGTALRAKHGQRDANRIPSHGRVARDCLHATPQRADPAPILWSSSTAAHGAPLQRVYGRCRRWLRRVLGRMRGHLASLQRTDNVTAETRDKMGAVVGPPWHPQSMGCGGGGSGGGGGGSGSGAGGGRSHQLSALCAPRRLRCWRRSGGALRWWRFPALMLLNWCRQSKGARRQCPIHALRCAATRTTR